MGGGVSDRILTFETLICYLPFVISFQSGAMWLAAWGPVCQVTKRCNVAIMFLENRFLLGGFQDCIAVLSSK